VSKESTQKRAAIYKMRDNCLKTVYKKGKKKHQDSQRVKLIFSLYEVLGASMASGVNVTDVQHI